MQRLVVLKFGGSVLRDEESLRLAVHEIYRWWRAGHGVVAVVSALAGRTDECLRVAHTVCASPAPESVAAFVATGELAAAALLGLQLDRAGVPACVLSPAAVRLTAVGNALDASPTALDETPIRGALARGEVVVVPGFVAQDEAGRTVVLGRGGSDLTALFLAQRLGASRCRLVKDVDGLYERDPARAGPRPARYARASYAAALACDGTIVQRKAVQFAREHGLEFELGRLNGSQPTRIGADPDVLAAASEEPRRVRVALLGCGTVGGGVLALLQALPQHFELVALALRDAWKERGFAIPRGLLAKDAETAARAGADVVVELLGGLQPARAVCTAALQHGAALVTANKRLLARHGAALQVLAREHGRALLASASVGGSMPLLERLALCPPGSVRAVRGILNSTTNFVLGRCAEGAALSAALDEARALGFAEADARLDLSGQDAADKLCVLSGTLGATAPREIPLEPVTEARLDGFGRGACVRQVASLELDAPSTRAAVQLEELDAADPLAHVFGVHNAAVIEHTDGTQTLLRGKGAGRWPTSEAVLADLLSLARRSASSAEHEPLARQVG